jgi:hypothetical protein
VTGHSYIVYGPLANGATTLMFEGIPTYPDASRFWQVIDKHQVNSFYTAPTAIRALMGAGDGFVAKTHRSSLRILGLRWSHHLPVVHIQYKNALSPNQHQRYTNKYRHLDNQKHIYASWQHTANNRLWYAIHP